MTSSPATFDPEGGPLEERNEPLATVFGLGGREDSVVFTVALVAALAVHAVAGARAMRVYPYLAELSAAVRIGMQDRLRSQVDIDMTEPVKPPEPPPPEPDPEPPPPAAQHKAPEPQAPPAAAEAGKVITAEPDPDAPVDLTDEGFVSGDGDRFAGGVTASGGTSKTAVRNPAAVATGIGTGTPKATVVAAPKVDLSRKPSVTASSFENCPFPSEADAEGINLAKVQVVVTIGTDGRARSVTVVKDPGFGFGKAARTCAMRAGYSAALNAAGQPIEQSYNFTVKFTR